MPPKKKRIQPAPVLPAVAVIRPESSPIRRYLSLIILIMMAISAAYLLLTGAGSGKRNPKQPQNSVPQAQVTQPPPQTQAEEQKSVVERVRSHISIDTAENPAMWTISSTELVRQQDPVLFKDAEVGDYVLAWSDRVVVYSAKKDKILGMLMASVPEADGSASAESPTSTEAAAEKELASVEIRNASGIAGAARRLKEAILKKGLMVTSVSDAAVRRTGTLIIDQTGGTADQEISLILGATSGTVVTALPEGEPASSAGVLILIGR